MGDSTPRRHHTVPRLYLSRFRDPSINRKSPQIWVTDTHTGHARPASVANETVGKDFYGPFEGALADEVDTSKLSALLDEIEQGNAFKMPSEDLGLVVFYVALQLTRTHAFRKLANEMARANLLEFLSHTQPPAVRDEVAATIERGEYSTPDFIRLMLGVAAGLYRELAQLRLFIVRARAPRFFITSDCPVATGPLLDGHTRPLGLQHDAVVFPLSPHTVMLMSRHLPECRYVDADDFVSDHQAADWARLINRLIVRRANRWLYAHRRDAAEELGLQFPVERFETVTASIGPGLVRTRDVLSRSKAPERGDP